jgi:PAS domain S-box-containing protein
LHIQCLIMTLYKPENYQEIFEHTGTAIALIDSQHTILEVNQEFVRLAGFSKGEIEGKLQWTSFIHADDRELMLTRHAQRLSSKGDPPASYEFRFIDRANRVHDIFLTVTVLTPSQHSIVSLFDVSEYKRYQHVLERRLKLEKIIAENSQNFIRSKGTEVDAAIQQVLKAIGEFAGVDRSYVFMYSEDEKFMSNTHEWCAPEVRPQIERLQDLPVHNFTWIDEELRAGRFINITDLEDLPPEAHLEKEILREQDIRSVAIVPLLFGGQLHGYLGFDSTRLTVHWSKEDFLLLQTIGNAIINAYVRSRLEHQLRQSNKMDAIGRFAGGIAHDFNNILATIQGNSQLLLYAQGLTTKEMELVDTINHATESGSSLTRQLLAFSRDEPLSAQAIEADTVLQKTVRMLKRLLPGRVEVKTAFESTHNRIVMDPAQMEQILMNLVLNSADAISSNGTIWVRTENSQLDEKSIINGHSIVSGLYLLITVQDTGMGMSPETLDKALEPFFTTKGPNKGTGLGLSTVYSIIRQNSGYMEIYSALEKGTRVDIYLPVLTGSH